jgi:hypothetical protein
MLRQILAGAAAGAAGTTALDAVSYADMALRGRPASSTPARTVERLAELAHLDVPGEGDVRGNRLSGLGALAGIATGVAVGAMYGAARALGLRASVPASAVLTGLAAMTASNGAMAALGVTDPRKWSAADWVSDVVPHLAYGVGTAATYAGMRDR